MTDKPAWYETFFSGIYSRVLGGAEHSSWAAGEADIVRRALKLRKGESVLDVPCGQGRLTMSLARRGMAMTGVDLTASYIRRARQAARKKRLGIRFVQSDMRRIEFDGEFDAAFNWFGSFGYFSAADNLAFTRRVFAALKPGGRFLVECVNKTWLLANFKPRIEQSVGRVGLVMESRFDKRTSAVTTWWTFTDGSKVERQASVMQMYSGPEIRELLRKAGFVGVRIFGRDGIRVPPRRFTRHSHRWLVVATKRRVDF